MSMSTHLYRSRDDRMLAGVAGGLAELWDADPSLVRLVWALLVILTGGIALVVYIVLAIVVPEEDDPRAYPAQPLAGAAPVGSAPLDATQDRGGAPVAPAPLVMPMSVAQTRYEAREARRQARAMRRAARGDRPHSGAIIVGVLFVLFGMWFLVKEYLPTIDWDWFWPATLVVLGAIVLFLALRPGSNSPNGSAGTPGVQS
jgi:phage shock protein C